MKHVKSFILVAAALFFLVGTVGVDVFSHFCEEEEVSVSYFIADDDRCEQHDHVKVHESTCCDVEVTHEDEHCEEELDACCGGSDEDHGCCQDEVKHVKLKLDFFDKYEIYPVIIAEFSSQLFYVFEEVPADITVAEYNNNSPPDRNGRDIILQKQYWLI